MVLRYFPTAESLPSCAILSQAARRTPTVHLHEPLTCARTRTDAPTVHEYKRARVGFETKTRQTEKVEENERTGEARISPCKANLFACIETEYRLKPSVTT